MLMIYRNRSSSTTMFSFFYFFFVVLLVLLLQSFSVDSSSLSSPHMIGFAGSSSSSSSSFNEIGVDRDNSEYMDEYKDENVYHVPTFRQDELEDLLFLYSSASSSPFAHDDKIKEKKIIGLRDRIQNALSSYGLIAIQQQTIYDTTADRTAVEEDNDDDIMMMSYSRAREIGFHGLCDCMTKKKKNNNQTKDMNDDEEEESMLFRTVKGVDMGYHHQNHNNQNQNHNNIVTRTTLATATVGTTPIELPMEDIQKTCSHSPDEETTTNPNNLPIALELLRDVVAESSQLFMNVFDQVLVSSKTIQYVSSSDHTTEKGSSSSACDDTTSTKLVQQQQTPVQPLLKSITGEIYPTLQSILKKATHLEHFHVYTNENTNKNDEEEEQKTPDTTEDDDIILDVHTDAGLFLSFVPGLRCNSEDDNQHNQQSDFYIQIKNDRTGKQKVVPVIFPPNTVGILVGLGAQNWLQLPKITTPTSNQILHKLTAAPHAVHMPRNTIRAWYGMMHMVPPDAIIQEYPTIRTFADMKQAMVSSSSSTTSSSTSSSITSRTYSDSQKGNNHENRTTATTTPISIGCGMSDDEKDPSLSLKGGRNHNALILETPTPALPQRRLLQQRRRLQMVDSPSQCNNSTRFYCWMSCLSIPDSDHLSNYVNDGYSLYCADPAILATTENNVTQATKSCNGYVHSEYVIGGAMNEKCVGVWQPTASGIPSQPFNISKNDSNNNSSSSSSESESRQNENDESLQYCYGKTSMFMDGFHWKNSICIVYLFPSWILTSQFKVIMASFGTILVGILLEGVIRQRRNTTSTMEIGWIRLGVSTLFYGCQLTLGYLIMLVVMTYHGPLFLSVVIGLMMGHVVFNIQEVLDATRSNRNEENNNKTFNITTSDNDSCNGNGSGGVILDNSVIHHHHVDDECPISDCCRTINNNTNCCDYGSTDMDQENGSSRSSRSIGDHQSNNVLSSLQLQQQKRNNKNKNNTRIPTYSVPEGITPCCQNTL